MNRNKCDLTDITTMTSKNAFLDELAVSAIEDDSPPPSPPPSPTNASPPSTRSDDNDSEIRSGTKAVNMKDFAKISLLHIHKSSKEHNSVDHTENNHAVELFQIYGDNNYDPIYHKNSVSELWIVVATLIHIIQWSLLLVIGFPALHAVIMAMLVFIMVLVTCIMLYARWRVRKRRSSNKLRYTHEITPDDETDNVPTVTVYCLAICAILEGVMFAIFTATTAGNTRGRFGGGGFFNSYTTLQILRFSSITFLAFHRTIRPANRIDPMRTVLELEIVSVCWDALDGSTLFELLDNASLTLGASISAATRALMAFWYLSVGIRIAAMFATHLPPESRGYRAVLWPPLKLSPQPTVDRTLNAMKIRSLIILAMAFAELFAGAIRLVLWSRDQLDSLQQDMTIKNGLFLLSVYGAYDMWASASNKHWNSRDIALDLKIPDRYTQLEIFRWLFVVSYLLTGALMAVILIHVSPEGVLWGTHIAVDVVLVAWFLVYACNVHVQSALAEHAAWLIPKKSFVLFPGRLGIVMSLIMAANLFLARIPALYKNYSHFEGDGLLWTYNAAMLVVILTIVPVGAAGMFWSVAFLLFRREFTACPGNYNAIHDPIITMVSTATMIEGALDIVSCATLMQLATNELPDAVNGAVMLFCLLECLNACQCFALQAILSGGYNDTPMDLVRWKAYLRGARALIDLGALILRAVLWIKYNAVSSVFLIKNLYNLIHAVTQIERYSGAMRYPKTTLFSAEVSPPDWYGLNKDEWRVATSSTVVAQARAGRTV